jgi:D-3-phosphoglycerate dehydrogenase
LSEAETRDLLGDIDAFICGDDLITDDVLAAAQPRLKVLSKYGIGVDKIDVAACTARGIPLLFTPGVNHTTVAEHTFLLMLALEKHIHFHCDSTREGGWKRRTGNELCSKTLGLVGLGRIGREVAIRARAFGMNVLGLGNHWDDDFAAEHDITRVATLEELLPQVDYLSLHTKLTLATRGLINAAAIDRMKPTVRIINCARGEIVDTADLVAALQEGRVGGYATDVLDAEPPPPDHPLLRLSNVVVTPHIGSRTQESVVRQAMKTVDNLLNVVRGEAPLAQVNPEVPYTNGRVDA